MQQGVLNVAKTAIIKKAINRFLVKSVFLLVKERQMGAGPIFLKLYKKRPPPEKVIVSDFILCKL